MHINIGFKADKGISKTLVRNSDSYVIKSNSNVIININMPWIVKAIDNLLNDAKDCYHKVHEDINRDVCKHAMILDYLYEKLKVNNIPMLKNFRPKHNIDINMGKIDTANKRLSILKTIFDHVRK